jgi:hypothetical protein
VKKKGCGGIKMKNKPPGFNNHPPKTTLIGGFDGF